MTSIQLVIKENGKDIVWYLDSSQTDKFMELLGKMEYINAEAPASSSLPPVGGIYAMITIFYDDGSSDELSMDLSKFHGDKIIVQSGGDELISYIWNLEFLLDRWERGVCINCYIDGQEYYDIPCSLEPIPES